MATKKNNEFLDLIQAQRKKKKKQKFKGSLLDYFDLVKQDPSITKLAHKRLYNAIMEQGMQTMPESDSRKNKVFDGDNIKVYDYFQSEFFGHERVIAKIMRFLKSAAKRGEESRQVLLLMGPVGAGKSALTEHIKQSIEQLSYYHLEGDPQKGEPLQLIPRGLRPQFEEALGA